MLVNRFKIIAAALLIFTARVVSVSYANHPTAGDQSVSDPSNSRTYLPLPPGR